ncbi:hypothetical protein ACSAZK_00535 [Methanosarcina sp. Mfa9]
MFGFFKKRREMKRKRELEREQERERMDREMEEIKRKLNQVD